MFLEIPGVILPELMALQAVTDVPLKRGWGGEKPKHVTPLGKSLWPKDVIDAIVKIWKAHGLKYPEKQKLVEPYAYVFGGIVNEGVSDLSKVNWEMAIDYFTWETEAIMNTTKAEELQNEAVKKYGGIFSHYEVYEDYSARK